MLSPFPSQSTSWQTPHKLPHSAARPGTALRPTAPQLPSGHGCSCIPPSRGPCATCPLPRALYVQHPIPRCASPDTVPWYLPPGALYLGQGSYYGTFHNASQEDQVQFCSPRGIGEGSQVVQDLLHGCGEGVGGETHRCQIGTRDQNAPQPPHLTPHRRQPRPSSTSLSARHGNAWGRALTGSGRGLFCRPWVMPAWAGGRPQAGGSRL